MTMGSPGDAPDKALRTASGEGPGDASDAWQRRHAERVATVSAPYGPLAPTGTHWLEDHPDGQLPDIPGRWTTDGEAVPLTAGRAAGLTVDGRPLDGEVRLTSDPGPAGGARVARGERRLVVLVREGLWGVRDFDPAAPARRAFRGIAATPYDPRWSVPGRFTLYEAGPRSVRVSNADGRERGPALGGGTGLRAGRAAPHAPGGRRGRRFAVGRLRRRHQRGHQLPLPVPAPGRAGRRGAYDGRPQPCRAAAVRVRRPLRLSLPAAGEHPGGPRRRGGARTALSPSGVW